MRTAFQIVGGGLVGIALGLGVGCSKPTAPAADTGEAPDYGQLLRNARERSAARMGTDRLSEAIGAFETEMGRSPTNLTELVRYGFIKEIPPAPAGKAYSYDSVNSVLLLVPARP